MATVEKGGQQGHSVLAGLAATGGLLELILNVHCSAGSTPPLSCVEGP